jgi:hypothetical protein
MGVPDDEPPIVRLPERFDRRLRLGPFPSARDALKFVGYAGVAALLAPFTSAFVWLAVAAAGFFVSVVRVDGQGLDDRALAFARWKLERSNGGRLTVNSPSPLSRRGLVPIAPGRYAAAVRAAGTPTAYLPPAELAARFERYREFLRSIDGPMAFTVGTRPMRAAPVAPAGLPPGSAADGYRSLVELLCRRRNVRRVDLVIGTERVGADGISDLETRIASLLDGLAAVGVRAARLRDRALEDAIRVGGWTWEPHGP